MLFRAILSLLSVPEGITAAGGAYGSNGSRVSSSGMGSRGGSLSSQRSDGNLGKNRWGSFRGRGLEGLAGPPPTRMNDNPADGADPRSLLLAMVLLLLSIMHTHFVICAHVGRPHLERLPDSATGT